MPSIDELRRWLQGENVEGYPERDDSDEQVFSGGRLNPALMEDCATCQGEGDIQGTCCPTCQGLGGVPRAKPRAPFGERMRDKAAAKKRGGKYRLSPDGGDAILMFGRHRDSQLSDLAKSRDGRTYLQWMSKEDFPQELLELVREWFNKGTRQHEHGSMKDKRI